MRGRGGVPVGRFWVEGTWGSASREILVEGAGEFQPGDSGLRGREAVPAGVLLLFRSPRCFLKGPKNLREVWNCLPQLALEYT